MFSPSLRRIGQGSRLLLKAKSIQANLSSPQTRTMTLLVGKEDLYKGIIIDHEQLPSCVNTFQSSLAFSLASWSEAGNRGIWLKIPKHLSTHIPIAVEHGFSFHHAEKDYVMLTNWLPETENTLPANASHQVGVGAFVLHPDGKQVLVVQEKNGPLKGRGVWKMPTGLVAQGEDLHTAAEREVLEETGVVAKFDRLLCFRQMHNALFGKSDLFFTLGLRAEGTEIVPQESEIEAATWMPIDEFLANPFYQGRPLYLQILESCRAWAEGRYEGLRGELMQGGFRPRPELLVYGPGDGGAGGKDIDAAGAGSVGASERSSRM